MPSRLNPIAAPKSTLGDNQVEALNRYISRAIRTKGVIAQIMLVTSAIIKAQVCIRHTSVHVKVIFPQTISRLQGALIASFLGQTGNA